MLGNWSQVQTDANAQGTYGTTESRTHNDTNELTNRNITGSGAGSFDLAYDLVGNIKERDLTPGTSSTKYIYTHDAWNRLVKVEYDDGTTTRSVAEYRYNGLHWRVSKKVDLHGASGGDSPDGTFDQQQLSIYTAKPRLIHRAATAVGTHPPAPAIATTRPRCKIFRNLLPLRHINSLTVAILLHAKHR